VARKPTASISTSSKLYVIPGPPSLPPENRRTPSGPHHDLRGRPADVPEQNPEVRA